MQPLTNVADQLFDLVIEIDPARTSWETMRTTALERCRALRAEIDRQLEEMSYAKLEARAEQALRDTLESASKNLRELSEAINESPEAKRWRKLYADLAKNYDQLTKTMSRERLVERVSFRRLTPRNYSRNLFHIASGLTGALLYHFVLSQAGAIAVMAALVVTFTTLEVLRRWSTRMNDALMRFPAIKRIARAREYYEINSATYYAYGMLAAVIVFPRQAVEAGCFVLAFGDPAASNIGRRFGRIKLVGEKSVAGTLAFVVAAFVPLFLFQVLFYADQSLARNVVVGLVGALVGAAAEVSSRRLDDNLTVPLAVSAALALVVP